MKRQTIVLTLTLTMILGVGVTAQTVDELIQNNIEAKGGYEALKAVNSMETSGKMLMQGMEISFKGYQKRQNKLRQNLEVQGQAIIQAYDGETAWMVNPMTGDPSAHPMPETEAKQFINNADIDGNLVDYKDKGHSIELLGKEEVDGTPAYKLKVTKANGDVVVLYLDEEYYIEFKADTTREIQGNEMEVSTILGDYKEVGGVMMAHSMEMGVAGNPAAQVITINQVDLNVDIDDDRFTMPEAKKAAEGAEAEAGE